MKKTSEKIIQAKFLLLKNDANFFPPKCIAISSVMFLGCYHLKKTIFLKIKPLSAIVIFLNTTPHVSTD